MPHPTDLVRHTTDGTPAILHRCSEVLILTFCCDPVRFLADEGGPSRAECGRASAYVFEARAVGTTRPGKRGCGNRFVARVRTAVFRAGRIPPRPALRTVDRRFRLPS